MSSFIFALCGALVGFFFGILYALAFLVTGGMPGHDGAVILPLEAMAIYVLSCASGGLIAGGLRSFLPHKFGSMVVGVLAMIPVMFGGAVLYYQQSVSSAGWWIVVIGSILIGIPIGLAIRREHSLFEKPNDRGDE
jgi:hypothetical protein